MVFRFIVTSSREFDRCPPGLPASLLCTTRTATRFYRSFASNDICRGKKLVSANLVGARGVLGDALVNEC